MQEVEINGKIKQIELAKLENERKKMMATINREDKTIEEKKKQNSEVEYIRD